MASKPHHDTIFVHDATVISHQAFAGDQYILRVEAPECAANAQPGQFVHLTCDPQLALRRPISIMRVHAQEGWVELLYKAVGHGTRLLAQRKPGETISVLGPIGKPFQPDPQRPRTLLLGGGVGMPPMIFLADHLRRRSEFKPLVLLGSEVPFPFKARPSQFIIPSLPNEVIASMPLLEDWSIPSRLASGSDFPGCFNGYITDLARCWLDALSVEERSEVELFSCGPHPMLAAVAKLAHEYNLPCQVSLEEYMACAVGGCAGCVVEVQTEQGPAMKRVCVDGPIFEAAAVFPVV